MNPLLRLLLVVIALLATPALAFGHAALIASVPSNGAMLSEAPRRVELRFSEAVTLLSVALALPDGTVQAVAAVGDGTTLHFDTPVSAALGTYLAIYRVVSEDGHPIGGTVSFSVGKATQAPEPATLRQTGGIPALLLVANGLAYFCLFIVVGTALAPRSGAGVPPLASKAATILCGIGLLCLTVSWPLQGADLIGLEGLPLLHPEVWRAPASSPGWWRIPMLAGSLFLSWLGVIRPFGQQRVLGAAGLLLFLVALVSSGHSATAISPWTMRVVLLFHLAGILAWIAPLPLLTYALWRQRSLGHATLARYSRCVPVPITIIVASGAALAVLQMGWPGPQWLSPYGAVLATKLCFLAIITALAWRNRYRLTKPTLVGDALAQQRLVRSILLEILVTILVLLSVAAWRFTPPPFAAAPPQEVATSLPKTVGRTHLHGSQVMAGLLIETAAAGLQATLELQDGDGKPLTARSVDLRLTVPDPALPPLNLSADNTSDGTWTVGLPALPAGRWEVIATVRIDDFTQVTLKGGVSVELPQP
jgi:copper transport protein